jgi:ABC-2 type transport system ATP-binding protein
MYSIISEDLTKRFGDFTSVDRLSFNVKEGEILGFLGSNGAGKSTTIKMLCGILLPTSGDATVGGFSVSKEPDKVKQKIGYMSQKFSLYNDLTVEENINFFGSVYGLKNKELKERKEWVVKIAYLKGKEKLLTGSLPGGIKQRLALGTAVIHRPEIVFLDEPTSGVDPISRRNFWDLINDLSSEGTTLFVTTHYLEEAEFCNNIILIDSGQLIAEGSSKELKKMLADYQVFEIESENSAQIFEILEQDPLIEEVSYFGNKIHLIAKQTSDSKERFGKLLLNKMQVDRINIQKISPTLEDVFIHLLKMKNNAS